jgi:hypothetical protein
MSQPVAAVDFGQGVSDAWRSVATFVPKFAAFLVILLVGWIVARMIAKIAVAVLKKVGLEKAVERGGLNRYLAGSEYTVSDLIGKLVYYAVLLIALQMSFSVFGPNPISDLLKGVVAFLPKAAVAMVIVVVAAAIARAVADVVRAATSGLSYGAVLANIAAVAIIALGVIAALNQMGVAVTVTMPVLITVLATVGGILVVGVGGGMIRPMQARWDRWLSAVERETASVRARQAEHAGRHPIPPQPPQTGNVNVRPAPQAPGAPMAPPPGYGAEPGQQYQ